MNGKLVSSIARALVVVESLDDATGRWSSLGFTLAGPRLWYGCDSVDIRLPHGGIRLISPASTEHGAIEETREASTAHTLRASLNQCLQKRGEGLAGWTWLGADTQEAAQAIDPSLTPGAVTLIETGNSVRAATPGDSRQRNRTNGIDHIVVLSGEVDKTAAVYERAFSLRAHGKKMKGRRFAFLKVGGPVIEVTGPLLPAPSPPPTLWGLAFRSEDLEETVATIRTSGIEVADPKPAIQGGRIVSLPGPFSGIPLAWLGK